VRGIRPSHRKQESKRTTIGNYDATILPFTSADKAKLSPQLAEHGFAQDNERADSRVTLFTGIQRSVSAIGEDSAHQFSYSLGVLRLTRRHPQAVLLFVMFESKTEPA